MANVSARDMEIPMAAESIETQAEEHQEEGNVMKAHLGAQKLGKMTLPILYGGFLSHGGTS